ncbi:MAG: DUF1592 domain-containing protein [Myxococcota bacterium]
MRRLLAVLILLGCNGAIGEPGAAGAPPAEAMPPGNPGADCSDPGPGNAPTLVRRLTGSEYASTIEAALDVEGDRSLLAGEVRTRGFLNDYGTLIPTSQFVLGARDFGRALGERLLEDGNAWLGHEPRAAGANGCIEGWLGDVGEPLFRRPLDSRELSAFRMLFQTLASEGQSPDEAAVGTLRALLLAPQTTYRVESPEGDVATSFELASRLAFFVTGAGPDAALRAAAEAGELATDDGVTAQVERLLQTPAAARTLDEFAYGWLHLDTLEGLTPTGDEAFDQELVASAQALVRAVWLEDEGELRDVFSADYVVPASARAARRQGVPGAAPGERYDVAGDARRAGILTEPAVLAGTGADSFPMIHRALFVYQDVLCQVVPEPPPGVTEAQPGGPTDSEREQSDARAADGNCTGCHSAFDPFAHAFEPYGFSGEWRDEDDYGNATRTDGVFSAHDGGERPYRTPAEFAATLREDPRINPCILERFVESAWGRALTDADACDVAQIRARFESLGSTYAAAVLAIATHSSFVVKQPGR